MTGSELLLLGLVVAAAVVAGYFIGRWSADRERGEHSARPNPLPAPGDDLPVEDSDDQPIETPAQRSPSRPRGAPPPASAGGDHGTAPPPAASRPRSASPPPASAGGGTGGLEPDGPAPTRPRRGPPPPAAAGVMGTGETTKKDR